MKNSIKNSVLSAKTAMKEITLDQLKRLAEKDAAAAA